jgi:hypothetical protein
LLSQPANTSASEHRDALVNKLMVATGLTADMPMAPFMRRDLPLFFETFESFKAGKASGSDKAPPGALAIADKVPASPPADAVSAQPAEAASSFPAVDVIKVSGSTNRYHHMMLPGSASGSDHEVISSRAESHFIRGSLGLWSKNYITWQGW